MQPAGGMAPPPMVRPPLEQQHQMPPPLQHPMAPSAPQPVPMQQAQAPPQAQPYQWPPAPHPAMYPQAQPQPQYPSAPPQLQYPPQLPQPQMWNQQPSQMFPVQPGMLAPPVQQAAAYGGVPTAVSVPSQLTNPHEVRTLWIADLQYWMDENYVYGCFASTGEVVSVKLIRNKQTAQSEGYGFVEFATRTTADRVLQTYNGTLMPSTDQAFRLNWAYAGEKRGDDSNDYTIFVGDLAPEVTDYMLQETFSGQYSSVKGAKVVIDRVTGRSKCYGFVRFGDANEHTRAMSEMNGVICSTKPMRIGPAANKKNLGIQTQAPQGADGSASETDPNNTTIFVGGLDASVTEDALRQVFSSYGEVIHVKIPVGKRCGFVQFAKRACAEEALLMLQGTLLGAQSIRLSWGRSLSSKQSQQDPSAWTSNYYSHGQGYETYGYSQDGQDPNVYGYGSYPGYANYQQQQ